MPERICARQPPWQLPEQRPTVDPAQQLLSRWADRVSSNQILIDMIPGVKYTWCVVWQRSWRPCECLGMMLRKCIYGWRGAAMQGCSLAGTPLGGEIRAHHPATMSYYLFGPQYTVPCRPAMCAAQTGCTQLTDKLQAVYANQGALPAHAD